jgi:hypothetical protein
MSQWEKDFEPAPVGDVDKMSHDRKIKKLKLNEYEIEENDYPIPDLDDGTKLEYEYDFSEGENGYTKIYYR